MSSDSLREDRLRLSCEIPVLLTTSVEMKRLHLGSA